MASSGGFHFVNPDNSSATGHIAKAKARAFVARKSRTDWSTKSENKDDRRRISRKPRAVGQRLPTISASGHENKEQSTISSSGLKRGFGKAYKTLQKASSHSRARGMGQVCMSCGIFLEEPETPNSATVCSTCTTHLTSGETKPWLPVMDSSLSPFGSAAVSVEPSCMNLLAFC